jgi:hypothetical protein
MTDPSTTWIKSRRTLVRLVSRSGNPERIAETAYLLVLAGRQLDAEQVPRVDTRAQLAGLPPGMVLNPAANVLDIWLDARRWRARLPIDDAVDAALAELDVRRRGLH